MKKINLKNIFFPLFFLIPIFLIGVVFFDNYLKNIPITKSHAENYVTIKNNLINIEIADEPQEQWQGLSNKKELSANDGMLFVFNKKQKRAFWMKNMHFPLDIIWISGNEIVKIDKRLEPEGELPKLKYGSSFPVNYVLEVNGGYTDAMNIEVGDKVEYNF